nr:ABC transporter A family member 9-like [Tanacetum cinerariifolium]
MEDHTSNWLKVVLISGLGQTMNGGTYRSVLCYWLGVLLFSVAKPCSACSNIFAGDIYEDHVVSCVSIVARAVIEAAECKRVKYEAKCANIGYCFIPFSLSSFGELKKDATMLLKRIQKFSVTQDTGARTVVHIFSKISFAIARGTMNGGTYRSVLCYWLGVLLFSVAKPCSACSNIFAGDIYEDHVVSCVSIVGIKHQHNLVRDTFFNICFWSRILAGKEVDIGLGGDYGMASNDYEGPPVFDDDQYEEESMPVCDTDIEDVMEEERFVGNRDLVGKKTTSKTS